MSATGKTPNYDLPIYVTGDTLTFADYNSSMLKIDTVMEQNSSTGTTQESQINELTQNVNTLTNQQTSMLTTLNSNTTKLGALETNQVNLETHMKDVDASIEGVQNITSTNSHAISMLTSTVNTNTSNIASVTTTANAANEKIDEVSELVAENTKSISELETQVDENTTDITDAKKDIDENMAQIASLESDVTQIRQTAQSAQETAQSAQETAQSAQETAQSAQETAQSAINKFPVMTLIPTTNYEVKNLSSTPTPYLFNLIIPTSETYTGNSLYMFSCILPSTVTITDITVQPTASLTIHTFETVSNGYKIIIIGMIPETTIQTHTITINGKEPSGVLSALPQATNKILYILQ